MEGLWTGEWPNLVSVFTASSSHLPLIARYWRSMRPQLALEEGFIRPKKHARDMATRGRLQMSDR